MIDRNDCFSFVLDLIFKVRHTNESLSCLRFYNDQHTTVNTRGVLYSPVPCTSTLFLILPDGSSIPAAQKQALF